MPDKYSNEQKCRKTRDRKAEKTKRKIGGIFSSTAQRNIYKMLQKVSQQQIRAFEKAICERVVCLPIYEKMLEEAEIQGYYCKAEVFNGSLKNKEYRSYSVVKIIDKNGELVHENGMETGVLMFYKTLCYSTLFHRVVEIQLNEDENFIKKLTDFTEKLKNQVCKIGE